MVAERRRSSPLNCSGRLRGAREERLQVAGQRQEQAQREERRLGERSANDVEPGIREGREIAQPRGVRLSLRRAWGGSRTQWVNWKIVGGLRRVIAQRDHRHGGERDHNKVGAGRREGREVDQPHGVLTSLRRARGWSRRRSGESVR